MRLGRYILGVILISSFTVFALANDELIKVIIFPEVFATGSPKSVYLPIYLLTSLAIFLGIITGAFIEYLRNFKLRQKLRESTKKLLKIEDELRKSKEKFLTEEEKIFDLLD